MEHAKLNIASEELEKRIQQKMAWLAKTSVIVKRTRYGQPSEAQSYLEHVQETNRRIEAQRMVYRELMRKPKFRASPEELAERREKAEFEAEVKHKLKVLLPTQAPHQRRSAAQQYLDEVHENQRRIDLERKVRRDLKAAAKKPTSFRLACNKALAINPTLKGSDLWVAARFVLAKNA